jgi:hypothetical protein
MLYSTYTYRRNIKFISSDADWQSAIDKNIQF